MTPAEIESFAAGFNLNSASYSGGAGGTFANLVTGEEDWTVQGATPSFSTVSGMEGMNFTNSSTQAIFGQMRARYEATIVAICRTSTTGVNIPFGGTNTAANTFAIFCFNNSVQAFHSVVQSGYTTLDTSMSSVANVLTVSFSPTNGTVYAQFNDNAPVSNSLAAKGNAALNWYQAAIGQHRTSYMNGWIGRVLIFSRALHFRDNTSLQSLIATEMASIGL